MPLLQAGHRDFGENRVQEAAQKWPLLRQRYPDIRLHLIGPLQTNKVKEALGLCDVIETLDRPKLAAALAPHYQTHATPTLYVQINTGEEPQKAGVLPRDAKDFIRQCQQEYRLPVVGVMCIPPADKDPVPHFAWVYQLAKEMNLPEISMGMSSDYPLAIRMGATQVRIGSALFKQITA